VEDYYKNLSGEFTPRPSASEIERLSVDETVAAMLAEQRRRKMRLRGSPKRSERQKRDAWQKLTPKRRDFEAKPERSGSEIHE